MSLMTRVSQFILPKEVDFFGNLHSQSAVVQDAVHTLYCIYVEQSKTEEQLQMVMENANQLRRDNLIELSEVMITPVDKEAISRAYLNLDWIMLSAKHLSVEIGAYGITAPVEFAAMFKLLDVQMAKLTDCFALLQQKKYNEVLDATTDIVRDDDSLIQEYSNQLAKLFAHDSLKHILRNKEILSQLKEISKRIHFCINTVEDIVFKVN